MADYVVTSRAWDRDVALDARPYAPPFEWLRDWQGPDGRLYVTRSEHIRPGAIVLICPVCAHGAYAPGSTCPYPGCATTAAAEPTPADRVTATDAWCERVLADATPLQRARLYELLYLAGERIDGIRGRVEKLARSAS